MNSASPKTLRLDRRLHELGAGTRSEVGRLIRRGHVEVDGELKRDPAHHVTPTAQITLDGATLDPIPRILAYNKPIGLLVTADDPWGRPTVSQHLPERIAQSLHPVGRLDADTTGLLLLSSDGALTQRLTHPRHQIEKEYRATVETEPNADVSALLAAGVRTAEGVHTATVLRIEGHEICLTVTEGKHRMVRRMLANIGLPVLALHRERIGAIGLATLPAGETRELTHEENAWLDGLLRDAR